MDAGIYTRGGGIMEFEDVKPEESEEERHTGEYDRAGSGSVGSATDADMDVGHRLGDARRLVAPMGHQKGLHVFR